MLPPGLSDTPVILKGVRFNVHAVELPRHSGGTQRREVVSPPDSVVVLPLLEPAPGDADERVVLIRNERFAVGRTLWELCAGTMEAGEDPATCGARELIEETGYRAETLEPIADFFPTPGFCTEHMHGFVARGLTHVGQDLDETEKIEVHTLPLPEAVAMIGRGEVQDGKTIALLLHYHVFRQKGRR